MKRLVLFVPLLFSLWARAETDQERQAREDLERQLKSLVGTPPTKIKVNFDALDEGNFKLLDAAFELDGHTLPVGSVAELAKDGTHLIFYGDVSPGPHKIESHVTYQDASSFMMSNEAGFKWKVGSSVSFSTQPGIEVDVNVTPVLDAKADDVKKKLKLTSPAKVVMLAQLDDGTMPPPLPKPKIAAADAADAGVEVVKGEKPKTKAELAAEAAEAKRKAKEEALAAKKAAAEEKKRLAEEARQARLAAAEEKRRAAEEARQAKLAAAQNAGNTGKPVLVAANGAAAAAEPVVDAGAPEPVDAGPAVAEVVDAGPPAVAEAPKPKVAAPAPPPPEENGIPLPLIIGIGVAVLGVIVFIATRKKNPQA